MTSSAPSNGASTAILAAPPKTLNPRDGAISGATLGIANRRFYHRVMGAGTISKLAVVVTVQSGNFGLEVFRNNGSDGRAAAPTGSPVATTGSVAVPAVGWRETALAASVDVEDGDWFSIWCDNTTAAFCRTVNTATGMADACAGLSGLEAGVTLGNAPGTVSAGATTFLIIGT